MKKFILAFSVILFTTIIGYSQYHIQFGGGSKYYGATSTPVVHVGIGFGYYGTPYANGYGYPNYPVFVPYFCPSFPPPNCNCPPPYYNYPPPNNNCAPPTYNPLPDNNPNNLPMDDNYIPPNKNNLDPDYFYLPPVYNSPGANSDDQDPQQPDQLKPNPNDPGFSINDGNNNSNNGEQKSAPKKVWVAAHWRQSNDGPVWIEGYWKKIN